VWGYRTSELPAFFTTGSGLPLEPRFDDPAAVARALRIHWEELESATGVVVAVPPPSPLPRADVEGALADALREASARSLPGKQVTPFLLSALARATAGRTQSANLDLLENNARVAAEISSALA
jgi:pseudouridine-5'-phosphate glycosidase